MALTAKQAIAHIEQTLAASPSIDPIDIVNGAGKLLYQMRQWNFRSKGPQVLTLTSGVAFVPLPADFGTLTWIDFTDALTQRVLPLSTLAELVSYRTANQGQIRDLFVAVSFEIPSGGSRIAPRLELYPTPSSTVAGALTYLYRSRWVDVEDDDANLPGVPELAELLYLRIARQLARSYEDEDVVDYNTALLSVRQSEEYQGAVRDDVSTQGSYGTLRKGIAYSDSNRGRGSFWDRPVNAPS